MDWEALCITNAALRILRSMNFFAGDYPGKLNESSRVVHNPR